MSNPTTPNPPIAQTKKTSHKASITGGVFAVLSLIASGLGSLIIRAKYTPSGPTNGSVEAEVGDAVAKGTVSTLGAIIGMPFLVLGITLAIIAGIFVMLRLPKVRTMGLILSVVVVLLIVLSFKISIDAFDLIRAKPSA